MTVDWGCENQIGYVLKQSTLTGTWPSPVYCRRTRPTGQTFCETCARRRSSGDTSLVEIGGQR